MSISNPAKPTVELEFDLSDIHFMRPVAQSGVSRDTLILRDKKSYADLAIYVVTDGRIIVVAIPEQTTVELVVTG